MKGTSKMKNIIVFVFLTGRNDVRYLLHAFREDAI
jgi:hypothetical protein